MRFFYPRCCLAWLSMRSPQVGPCVTLLLSSGFLLMAGWVFWGRAAVREGCALTFSGEGGYSSRRHACDRGGTIAVAAVLSLSCATSAWRLHMCRRFV